MDDGLQTQGDFQKTFDEQRQSARNFVLLARSLARSLGRPDAELAQAMVAAGVAMLSAHLGDVETAKFLRATAAKIQYGTDEPKH